MPYVELAIAGEKKSDTFNQTDKIHKHDRWTDRIITAHIVLANNVHVAKHHVEILNRQIWANGQLFLLQNIAIEMLP